MTKSQEVANDISALLRARNPLIWIVTREEGRVERYLAEAAAAAGYVFRTWDIAAGVTDIGGKKPAQGSPLSRLEDPVAALSEIEKRAEATVSAERCAWVMRDLAPWLAGAPGAAVCRRLRNLAKALPVTARNQAQAIIVLSPSKDIPAELAGHTTVIEWPMPDRAEIEQLLDAAINALPEELREGAAPNGQRAAAIDAAVGLSGEEASNCFARSLVQLRRIDPVLVAKEKRRVIARERVLEWFDPLPGGLDAVGGLENLKGWLNERKSAYSPAARAYGLPSQKGAMLVGISGCGKSLTAKAIATAWGVPLLRVDLGGLKSKFVGESEANLRKAFDVIAAIGRCVVWFDEIEKGLAGATQGAADGGVSSDALGTILTWMQERQGEAFVVATANDVQGLPPEFLRKGRFDELFFVDLPNLAERAEIVQATLRSFGRADAGVDCLRVAQVCEGFTGSEVAAIVPDALFAAFNDGARQIAADDLVAAASRVVPLSQTASEKIQKLRDWAKGKTRPANAQVPVTGQAAKTDRVIDLS